MESPSLCPKMSVAAGYKENGSKSQLVFDQQFKFLHSKNIPGSVPGSFASLIANSVQKKPPKHSKRKTKTEGSRHPSQHIKAESPNPSDFLQSVASASSQAFPNLLTPNFVPIQNAHHTNPHQVQWSGLRIPQIEPEPLGDDLSENMDLSSGPEADAMSIDLSAEDTLEKALQNRPKLLTDTPGGQSRIDLSDYMDLSSGPEADDESDAPSLSQRPSSTPSKGTGASSHTSVAVSNDVKISVEQSTPPLNALRPASPTSSLSSQLSPAKSMTPIGLKFSVEPPKSTPRRRTTKSKKIEFTDQRPRTSIPSNLTPIVLAQQGIHAAYASRLDPFKLHPDEYQLLRERICHAHVTAYLNIRNRILRLWVRNPLVAVTAEEAAGCALATRWIGLAQVAYEWLLRKGYINFGCVEIPEAPDIKVKRYKLKRVKRKTIVVVGAGMSGLGCARQLEGLIQHYRERWLSTGEELPRVVLLEGRNRIGGRVYSHPLKDQNTNGVLDQKRCTAELGAHIIIGFDHGNPLSMIVRGQLALQYHALKDNSIIYDIDGNLVGSRRDKMAEDLYNDILDRASVYRHRLPAPTTVEGDRELIQSGRDPQREGGPPISALDPQGPPVSQSTEDNEVESVPGGMDKLTGKAHLITGPRRKDPPARTAEKMGWKLGEDVLAYAELNLDVVTKTMTHPTLGAAMDEAVKHYQFLLDLSPQDMRLINWHYANLEYANAANIGKLSLAGWDQDAGNEFEGPHAQVVGGYQQVPRGILQCPNKLDLRTRKAVNRITYNLWSGNSKTAGGKVHCADGDTIEADHIVLTTSLGILKEGKIAFDPPLPDWKLGPIERLGFGILNKVILAYDKAFWDVDQDMFGLLREPEVAESLDQEDYEANRGRFYFFWNCVKTTGRPILISLMAGDAAHQAEKSTDAELVAEVTRELAKIFKQQIIPSPLETIVTRWGTDRFARGSYSFVGAKSEPRDYETMALPVGNLHFAGEATCATHPATVHGAYISGLRAASEVIGELLGPIELPNPLVPLPNQAETAIPDTGPKRKSEVPKPQQPRETKLPQEPKQERPQTHQPQATEIPQVSKEERLRKIEAEIVQAIVNELGYQPVEPKKTKPNGYLIYTTEKWPEVKKVCEDERLATPNARGYKQDLTRARISTMWKALSKEEQEPYHAKAVANKALNEESVAKFPERLREWEKKAIEVRRQYIRDHPGVLTEEEEQDMWKALGVYGNFDFENEARKAKKMGGYSNGSDGDGEQ